MIASQAVHATLSPKTDDSHIAELFRHVAAGDVHAFAGVYDTIAPRVWAMARAVTCDVDLAEFVAVQAFETVWRAASSCPVAPEAAMAWTMGIAVRRSVSAATAGNLRRRSPWEARTPHRDERVRMALFALPEGQRHAILLSCCGRLSLGSVACALEVPRHEAAALLCDALTRLGGLLHVGGIPSASRDV